MNSNDFMEPLILNDKYMSIAPLWNICVIWCRKKHRLHRIVYLLSHIWTYISWFECGSQSRKSCQLKSQKLIMIFKFWLVKKASRSSSSEIQNQCRKISTYFWKPDYISLFADQFAGGCCMIASKSDVELSLFVSLSLGHRLQENFEIPAVRHDCENVPEQLYYEKLFRPNQNYL